MLCFYCASVSHLSSPNRCVPEHFWFCTFCCYFEWIKSRILHSCRVVILFSILYRPNVGKTSNPPDLHALSIWWFILSKIRWFFFHFCVLLLSFNWAYNSGLKIRGHGHYFEATFSHLKSHFSSERWFPC